MWGWEGAPGTWERVAGGARDDAGQHGRTATQHKAFIGFVQLSRAEAAVAGRAVALRAPRRGCERGRGWGHSPGTSRPPGNWLDVQPRFGYDLAWATCKVCTNQASSQRDGNWGCPSDLWGFCAPVAASEGLVCLPRVASWPGSRARGRVLFHS